MSTRDLPNITEWLNDWMAGGDEAFDKVYPHIVSQLKKTARVRRWKVGLQNLLMTDEVLALFFLELKRKRDQVDLHFNSRNEFMAYYSEVVKGLVINEARKMNAQKRGGDLVLVSLSGSDSEVDNVPSQVENQENSRIRIIDLYNRLDLLYKRDLIAYKYFVAWYFGGFEQQEIAAYHGVNRKTVMRKLEFAKAVIRT